MTLVKLITKAARDVKAIDLVVLNLQKLALFTDYFVICSGKSDRQVRAIADNIVKTMNGKSKKPIGIEGYSEGLWVLIDCGDVVAHVFYQEVRDYYGLEKLWGDAKRIRM